MKRFILTILVLAVLILPASAQEKFSLSMFHFNVQYVAGGLVGFLGDTGELGLGLDAEKVENLIISESFVPLITLLENHPDWKLTLEFQGYMLELIAERFPEELARLKALADAGRVELVSFHYSDQFFLAYPRRDLEKSIELTRAVFADNDIPHSGTIFTQEGQFGIGMCPVAADNGYDIVGLPKNLFRYLHEGVDLSPWWNCDGMTVIPIGEGFSTADLEVTWSFFDDGELAMTGDMNPYMGELFAFSQDAYDAYEQKLQEQADNGFRIATVGEYVEYLATNNVAKPQLPPILDGDWQPKDTLSIWFWMGRKGIWPEAEDDNGILTANYRNSQKLRALEILAESTGRNEQATIDAIWREHSLACVSDATGQRPWDAEVNYARNLQRVAAGMIDDAFAELADGPVSVNLQTGEVIYETSATEPAFEPADAPLDVDIVVSSREHNISWEKVSDAERWRLNIDLGDPDGSISTVKVSFPRYSETIEYTPAMLDDVYSYSFTEFTLQTLDTDYGSGWFILPCANGLIGLGDGWYVIKNNTTVHLAFHTHPDVDYWWVENEIAEKSPQRYSFELLKGTAIEAIALAREINEYPIVSFDSQGYPGASSAASESGDDDSGCSCHLTHRTSPEATAAALLLICFSWLAVRIGSKRRKT